MSGHELIKIAVCDLIPYARNARTHSDAQVAQIAASIREFGFCSPVLVDGDNGIIAGHGRVLAARKLGMTEVPCVRLLHLSPVQKRAYVLADNKLALNAGWDEAALRLEIDELQLDGLDIGLIGFDLDEIKDIKGEDDSYYSRKIEAPIYEITGDNPPLQSLADTKKTNALIQAIDASGVESDVKEFLRLAAHRHTVFNYKAIAERYAHSSEAEQRLFEASALVIIDFNAAIEKGFVTLTKKLAEQYKTETEGKRV